MNVESLGGATGDIDFAMHGIDKMADNPKANSEAALLTPSHGALEGIEDAGLVFFRDADAVIPNGRPQPKKQITKWAWQMAAIDPDQEINNRLKVSMRRRPGSRRYRWQTCKLFEVCRVRDVLIITFVKKLDREGYSDSVAMLTILKLTYSHSMFRLVMSSKWKGAGCARLSDGRDSSVEPSDIGRVVATKRGNLAADLLHVHLSALIYTIYNCMSAGLRACLWPPDSSWQNAVHLSYPPSMPPAGPLAPGDLYPGNS